MALPPHIFEAAAGAFAAMAADDADQSICPHPPGAVKRP
jgi:myosin heavy subunit